MSANQTQIPVIQHKDKDVVQLQQNVNKVLRNINNQVVSNAENATSNINQSTIIGEIKTAMLTESQFQSQAGENWVLSDGRSVPGSTYESITGKSSIPDLRGQFLRAQNGSRSDGNQNPDGNLALGTFTTDKFASHTHSFTQSSTTTVGPNGFVPTLSGGTGGAVSTQATGGNETAPKNVTVNFFIRIN